MDVHLVIRLTLSIVLFIACTSIIEGSKFVGDLSPIIVDVQGRVQRKNVLFGYTNKFRVKGSQPFRRLQGGLCKSSRFRLRRPKFLQAAIMNCNLVTVSWNKPWVTLRITFNRTILIKEGLTGGGSSFFTLLRDNLEKYRVCDCLDAFTGRLYFAYARELLAVAAVEVIGTTKIKTRVNHTIMATEILRRFSPIYGLETAFRNVFLKKIHKSENLTSFLYKFYFSEHILLLNGVDIYCNDFMQTSYLLLSKEYKRPKEKFLYEGFLSIADRAHEDFLDMQGLLKPSHTVPFPVELNFIPENAICPKPPMAGCKG